MCMLICVKFACSYMIFNGLLSHNYTLHPMYYTLIPIDCCACREEKEAFHILFRLPLRFCPPQPTKPKRHRFSRLVNVWALFTTTNQAQEAQTLRACTCLGFVCNNQPSPKARVYITKFKCNLST